MIRIGSLFTGIGGLDLGLEMAFAEAGILARVEYQVEIDPFCRAVLAKHWPNVPRFEDVQTESLPDADLLCGGFPCQDLSVAGRGAGLTGKRSQLWWDYARHIARIHPAVAIVENVSHGRGRWLPYVRRDLCRLGYRTRAVQVSARDVGAPHLRERVFVIAYAHGEPLRLQQQRLAARPSRGVRDGKKTLAPHDGLPGHVAGASNWAPRPCIRGMDDGFPRGMDNDRNRTLGNAAVPQAAQVIGRIIIDDTRREAA